MIEPSVVGFSAPSTRLPFSIDSCSNPLAVSNLFCSNNSRPRLPIELIVRGHTRLRPGVPGYSENIRVRSIIGRFLEHSRIFYFHNNGDEEVFIGSADWMRRNLDDRVEVMVPIHDKRARKRLIRSLSFCMEDNRQSWDLQSDGRYLLTSPEPGKPTVALHETLMRRARRRTEEDDAVWTL